MRAPRKSTLLLLAFLISGAAWSFAIGAHELLGHGGHCALDPDCSWKYVDAMYFDGEYASGVVDDWQRASGSLVQMGLALVAALILRVAPPRGFGAYCFLWALAAAGLIQSGAYIAFGWLIHPGMDWAQLVEKAGGGPMQKGVATAGGALIILIGILIARRLMPRAEARGGDFTGPPLVIAAYLGFSATALGASWFVPADDRLFMLYGGIGGGAGFMFWFLFSALPKGGPSPTLKLKGAWTPAIVSMIAIFTYVFVLGRGVHF